MTTAFTFNPFTSNFDIITTGLGPSDITGGTPNTVAGWDSTGALETIPGWNIDTTNGGLNLVLNLTPSTNPNQTDAVNQFETVITPTVDLTQYNFVALQNSTQLIGPKDFSVFTAFNNTFEYDNAGSIGQLVMNNTLATLGDGANASSSQSIGQATTINVRALHQADNVQLVNNVLNLGTGSTSTNVSGYSQNINVDGAPTNVINGINTNLNNSVNMPNGYNAMFMSVNMNADINYISGYDFDLNAISGTITNSVNSYQDNGSVASGVTISNGYYSYVSYPNLLAGSTVGGYGVLNANPNIAANMAGHGFSGVQIGGQLSNTMDYSQPVTANTSYNSGANVINDVISFSDFSNVQSGGTVSGTYQSMVLNPQMHAGATVAQLNGLSVGPSINATIPGSANMLNINPNGSGLVNNLTGISVNLSGMNSTGRKVALSIDDGVINANSSVVVQSGGVDSANLMVPQINVLTPTTGTILGLNAAALFNIQDDFTSPTIGANAAGIGFVAQLNVASTKTVSAISLALAGVQVSGDGTTTDLQMFDAIGAIPGTGTPIITNEYLFRGRPLVPGGIATNLWGISIEDSAAENFFQKSLAINTTSHKVSSGSIGLEIKTKDVLLDGGSLTINALNTAGVVHNSAGGLLSTSLVDLVNDVTGVLGETHGGTNQSAYTTGDMLYANATNALTRLVIGNTGDVLTVSAGVPVWAPAAGPADSTIALSSGIGHGSSGTAIRTFVSNSVNTGTDLTYTSDSTNGDYVTVNATGRYSMMWLDRNSGGGTSLGFTVNQSNLTQDAVSVPTNELIFVGTTPSTGGQVSATYYLSSGDIVRFNDGGGSNNTVATAKQAIIMRIG